MIGWIQHSSEQILDIWIRLLCFHKISSKLILSLISKIDIDLYTPILEQIKTPVEIQTNAGVTR